MAVGPEVIVSAPVTRPHRFGLFSVAAPVPIADPHERNGVIYPGPGRSQVELAPTSLTPPPGPVQVTGRDREWATANPIRVRAAFETSAVGIDEAGAVLVVEQRLASGEQRAVEEALWSLVHDRPLMSSDTVELTTTAVPLHVGVGMLEQHLAGLDGGEGVIHAPRLVGAIAGEKSLILSERGERRVTPLGNGWSFGGGYGLTGPDGDPAADGTAWLVITPPVEYRATDVATRPSSYSTGAFNPSNNDVWLTSERTFVVSIGASAPFGAVLVDLTA